MTAISVSERLLEMAAFYTWLDFTLTTYIHYYNTRQGQRNLGVLTPMEKHELGLAA